MVGDEVLLGRVVGRVGVIGEGGGRVCGESGRRRCYWGEWREYRGLRGE